MATKNTPAKAGTSNSSRKAAPKRAKPTVDNTTPELPQSDAEFGEWIKALFGAMFLFVTQTRKWFENIGHVWAPVSEDIVAKRIADKLGELQIEAESSGNDDGTNWYHKHRRRKHINSFVNALRQQVIADDPRNTNKIRFNALTGILNFRNCSVDLSDAAVVDHDPSHFFTKCSPVAYIADAKNKEVSELIRRLSDNNKQKVDFMQKVCGSFLRCENPERVITIFHAEDVAGISLLVKAIASVIGDDALVTEDQLFTRNRNDSSTVSKSDIAKMEKYRFVASISPGSDQVLNEATVKHLASRGCNIAIVTDHLPLISLTNKTIWDNVAIVPVESVELSDSMKSLTTNDNALKGLAATLVAGAVKSFDKGVTPFPAFIAGAVEKHRAAVDTIQMFVADCCKNVEGAITPGGLLFDAYKQYCTELGIDSVYHNIFFRSLTDKGYQMKPGNKAKGRVGIQLLDEAVPKSGRAKDKSLLNSPAGKVGLPKKVKSAAVEKAALKKKNNSPGEPMVQGKAAGSSKKSMKKAA